MFKNEFYNTPYGKLQYIKDTLGDCFDMELVESLEKAL